MNDEPIDLERERRIRQKVRSLGESIEAADETDELADDPEGYLKRKAKPMTDDQKQMYSVRDVAELFDVDPESVRRWIRSGNLKASKVGRGYRVSRADLEAYYRDKGGGDLFATEEGVRHHVSVLLADRLQPYRVGSTVFDGGEHIILEYGIDVEGESIGSVSTQVDDRSAREVATELVGKVPGGDRD